MWESNEKVVDMPTVVKASTLRCDMCSAVLERRVSHPGINDDTDFKRMFTPYVEVDIDLKRYTEPDYNYDRKPTEKFAHVTVCDKCAQKILKLIGKEDAKDED